MLYTTPFVARVKRNDLPSYQACVCSPRPLLNPYAASPAAETTITPPRPSQLRRLTGPEQHRPRAIITNAIMMMTETSRADSRRTRYER